MSNAPGTLNSCNRHLSLAPRSGVATIRATNNRWNVRQLGLQLDSVPTGERRERSAAAIVIGSLAILLGVAQAWRLFAIANRYGVDVPFFDQWGYYDAFFKAHSIWEIFAWQHGPHRQGIGFFLTWLINWATHWDQRAQSFLICGTACITALVALGIKKRVAGTLRWYDVILPLIILSPQQWEAVIGTPNVSHGAMPLLLILLSCAAWTIAKLPLRYASVLILDFLATFTGFGIFMGLVTPFLLLLALLQAWRRRDRHHVMLAGGAIVAAMAILAVFRVGYVFAPGVSNYRFPDPNWHLYPAFVGMQFTMLCGIHQASALNAYTGLALAGAAALTCSFLAWATITRPAEQPGRRIALLLLAFTLLFSINAAIGRLCLGLEAATNSRYFPLMAPALISACFLLTEISHPKSRNLATALLLAIVLFASIPQRQVKEMLWYHDGKSAWVDAYRRTGNVVQADKAASFVIYPNHRKKNIEPRLQWLRDRQLSLFRTPPQTEK